MTWWYAVGVAVLVNIAAIAWSVLARRRKLRDTVKSNLDNAVQNGYFTPDGHLSDASPGEIADDLVLYAVDCEDYTAMQLEPYVREWLDKRGWTWSE